MHAVRLSPAPRKWQALPKPLVKPHSVVEGTIDYPIMPFFVSRVICLFLLLSPVKRPLLLWCQQTLIWLRGLSDLAFCMSGSWGALA